MSDSLQFAAVLRELEVLWLRLGDLAAHLLVIGGQVIALESRARGGDGVIAVQTPVGPVLERGFSHDLDLLYDGDAGFLAERLPQVLRECGFVRSTSYRWTKVSDGLRVDIDLLAPEGIEEDLPTPMSTAPGGEIAVRRPARVAIGASLEVAVPDPVGFLALKLGAKRSRPKLSKDSFDLYAYVHLRGPAAISLALAKAGRDGERIKAELRALFGDEDSQGVVDVLDYAATLEEADRALVARTVVDLFDEALR